MNQTGNGEGKVKGIGDYEWGTTKEERRETREELRGRETESQSTRPPVRRGKEQLFPTPVPGITNRPRSDQATPPIHIKFGLKDSNMFNRSPDVTCKFINFFSRWVTFFFNFLMFHHS